MKKYLIFFLILIAQNLYAQNGAGDAPPGAAMESKTSDSKVNLFTGLPSISVPIYQYKSNSGIGINVSVDYAGGGIQVDEGASIVGLGWHLNFGGSVVRTVRGAPDDYPGIGYLNAGTIPSDFRNKADSLYKCDLDPEQDIFQFNLPTASGRFYIGKDKKVIVVPYSKINIKVIYDGNGRINTFKIRDEEGNKYEFTSRETMSFTSIYTKELANENSNMNRTYTVKWNLGYMISAFNTDTISFSYNQKSFNYAFNLPQNAMVNDADTSQKTINYFDVSNTGNSQSSNIETIFFPNKTKLKFLYEYPDQARIHSIQLWDTTFRMGYLFNYQDTVKEVQIIKNLPRNVSSVIKPLLVSVIPYTKLERSVGYSFEYYKYWLTPTGVKLNTQDEESLIIDFQNAKDYWGFFNSSFENDKIRIPKVKNYKWGANRQPSLPGTRSSSLYKVILPSGGNITYQYELNTRLPYTVQDMEQSFLPQNNNQLSVSFIQVYNDRHSLSIITDRTLLRNGNPPISGTGLLNLQIKNGSGTVLQSTTVSIAEIYKNGIKNWEFNLPNGNYYLYTNSSGTTFNGSIPMKIQWINRIEDLSKNEEKAGGLRVHSISYRNINYVDTLLLLHWQDDTLNVLPNGLYPDWLEEYQYVREDGKSSGFASDIPKYDYPFTKFAINGGTTITNYTKLSSEPLSLMDYSSGSPVAYSRVVVRKTDATSAALKSLGSIIYEFTDLKDANNYNGIPCFPYTPAKINYWGLGLPKCISVYDSSGLIKKRTVNVYQYDTISYKNDNFKSLKLGQDQIVYNGDPYNPNTPKEYKYSGDFYWLQNGRTYLKYVYDTVYQKNGSLHTSYKQFFYDTNYNVIKTVTGYDRTRGLVREDYNYYPYNYSVGGAIGRLRDSSLLNNVISSESWITGDGNPRLVALGATSYQVLTSGHIKPDTVFLFESNKPVAQSAIGVFNPGKLVRNYSLIKPRTKFIAYDTKGELVETKNIITSQSNTVIKGYDDNYVIASITNATKDDVAYTSFETKSDGYWSVSGTSRDLSAAITGKKSYNLNAGSITRNSLSTSKQYLVSVWLQSGASATVNGLSLGPALETQQGWSLYSIKLSGISSVSITGTGLIDELRLHPVDAYMQTSTYEPLLGATSTADAANNITYNEYDKLNRLQFVRNKDLNILKKMEYTDTTMPISRVPQWISKGSECSEAMPGDIDSTITDINPFSDSYNSTTKLYGVRIDCNCNNAQGRPELKLVNGICERGSYTVTSSVYRKVGTQWFWFCTYRYCFSDGSQSQDIAVTQNSSSCMITCFIPL